MESGGKACEAEHSEGWLLDEALLPPLLDLVTSHMGRTVLSSALAPAALLSRQGWLTLADPVSPTTLCPCAPAMPTLAAKFEPPARFRRALTAARQHYTPVGACTRVVTGQVQLRRSRHP